MNKEQLCRIVADISILDRLFEVTDCADGWYVQVTYFEPDVDTGKTALQKSRKWLVEPSATESDVVRTVYAAVSRSYAHVVSENFTYKGRRVFGPHVAIDALLETCGNTEPEPAPRSAVAIAREWRGSQSEEPQTGSNPGPLILLPAVAGTARDPNRRCVVCNHQRFEIKSDGPNQAWLRCLECGAPQPSGASNKRET